MGDKLEWFISLQNDGVSIPILNERPDIIDSAIKYWRAYNLLASSRRIGMGAGMIPLSEILAYCDLMLIDHPDDRIFLTEIIIELDTHYISKMSDKEKKKNGNTKS